MTLSTSPVALSASLETLDSRAGGDQWRETSRLLYRYLVRDMQDARDHRKALYPETHGEHVLRTLPVVQRTSLEIASLYRRAPARTFEVKGRDGVWSKVDDATADLIANIYRGAKLDVAFRDAQRMAVATGNAPLLIFPVAKINGVRPVLVPPHEHDLELEDALSDNEKDLSRWWVKLPIARSTDSGSISYGVAQISRGGAAWTDGKTGGLWFEDESNPIDDIPLVMVRATSAAPGEWWAHAPEDLFDGQRAANHDWTDIGQITRMQGYGQGYVKGMTQEQVSKMQTGPETWAGLPGEDAELGFASPSPDIKANQEQLEGYLSMMWGLLGLNPDGIRRSSGVTALAKMVERADREQERQDWVLEFRRVEQRTYDLVRKWVNHLRGAEVLPHARVTVEYRDSWLPADPLHEAQARGLAYAQGTSSPVMDLARERGMTREEAHAEVARNIQDIADLGIITGTAPPKNIDEQGGGTKL